jgi:hypothetical protein
MPMHHSTPCHMAATAQLMSGCETAALPQMSAQPNCDNGPRLVVKMLKQWQTCTHSNEAKAILQHRPHQPRQRGHDSIYCGSFGHDEQHYGSLPWPSLLKHDPLLVLNDCRVTGWYLMTPELNQSLGMLLLSTGQEQGSF